jgi:hypothetical protein
MIWLIGSLGVLITRLIKYLTLSGRTFRNDYKTMQLIQNNANIQTLFESMCIMQVRKFIVYFLNRLHICVLPTH